MNQLLKNLNFSIMITLYMKGLSVARSGWAKSIDRASGYVFTEEDKQANDWMVF